MKSISSKNIVRSLAAIVFASLGSSAFAASTWGFGSGCGATDNTRFASVSCAANAGADAVTVTAFSVVNASDGTIASGTSYAAASLGFYSGSGFGATYLTPGTETTNSPQHTVDNVGQTELLLLNFGNYKVDLDSVTIGFKDTDADISVFRYTGPTPNNYAAPVVAGVTRGGLSAAGWTLVGNYADLVANTAKNVNIGSPADTQSSWWLISAYNSSFGSVTSAGGDNQGETTGSTNLLQNNNDYFKVISVAGNATRRLPEPDSLLLFVAGLLGLMASRRRKPAALTA